MWEGETENCLVDHPALQDDRAVDGHPQSAEDLVERVGGRGDLDECAQPMRAEVVPGHASGKAYLQKHYEKHGHGQAVENLVIFTLKLSL